MLSRNIRIEESLADQLFDSSEKRLARVNCFLNKFKKLGFIDYDGNVPLTINSALLSVVLHD